MDPEVWRWVWLVAAAAFIVGEITVAGTFFLLPFGLGAAVAAVFAFSGAGSATGWTIFVSVSVLATIAVRPIVRRLDATGDPISVGAERLIGQAGVVISDLSADADRMGAVRVGREEWHAESSEGIDLPVGTAIEVIDILGTRALVRPVDSES
ncbi:MAG: NfeD family protein [Acidimicrobiales bacterium]|jgi:membrane protein implicated in regulation of membrane protease activity|nr:NfeD family protein [Actinomycetes bacterium]MDP6106003.1 NfeD family protein [Acidimicrobiales bacterium]MCP4845181.1 NfeD family protein [Actinomycetes bacterium]MDP6241275.1 NfeD family protein [Acidimicrobiales bacterium]MDP7124276.1 NfeD family protein [Acidimicrobiales bacterium]|tara:strand:+ start:9853 stop:10311 length:459 start_codon:yes stop_codon:yes gene_type:complete